VYKKEEEKEIKKFKMRNQYEHTNKYIYDKYTLNNDGLLQPKFKSNMDKPKCWVKKAIKNV